MRLSLSILGQEVWCLRWCRTGCGCLDCAAPADDGDTIILGGSGHDFERDTAPLDPTDHYGEWEDRKRFGFGVRS